MIALRDRWYMVSMAIMKSKMLLATLISSVDLAKPLNKVKNNDSIQGIDYACMLLAIMKYEGLLVVLVSCTKLAKPWMKSMRMI